MIWDNLPTPLIPSVSRDVARVLRQAQHERSWVKAKKQGPLILSLSKDHLAITQLTAPTSPASMISA